MNLLCNYGLVDQLIQTFDPFFFSFSHQNTHTPYEKQNQPRKKRKRGKEEGKKEKKKEKKKKKEEERR